MRAFVVFCLLLWALGAGIAFVDAHQPLLIIGLVGTVGYALMGIVDRV